MLHDIVHTCHELRPLEQRTLAPIILSAEITQ